MLARTFLTAKDLDIPQEWLDALIVTLPELESGRYRHIDTTDFWQLPVNDKKPIELAGLFNMAHWYGQFAECGTVCCIGGLAELTVKSFGMTEVNFDDGWHEKGYRREMPKAMSDLFYPAPPADLSKITVEQAAQALRNYLTMGDAQWASVLGMK